MNPVTQLLTEDALAQRWGVSVRTLQAQRYSGAGVPYLKLGAAVRYSVADVEAYEAAHKRDSTSQVLAA